MENKKIESSIEELRAMISPKKFNFKVIEHEVETLENISSSMKWKCINNMFVQFLKVVIMCISIYMCVNYSMWWILLLMLF